MRKSRRVVFGAASLAIAVLASACGSGGDDGNAGGGGTRNRGSLTIGVSGAFAENQIVAEMYAQVLENAGYSVKRELNLGTREISDKALQNGQIDIKPEYLSSELLFLDPEAEASGDPEEVAAKVSELLRAKGVTLLTPSAANDTNAIVTTPETAEQHGLGTVSDLAGPAGSLTFGGPPECPERPFCLPGLEKTYGIHFKDFKPLDVGGPQTVAALEGGAIDVALLFSTSSVIADKGWVVLQDDKNLQNAENITPVVRTEVLNDEIRSLLNAVSEKLTTENITELNEQVEIDKDDPADVARGFLEDSGLL